MNLKHALAASVEAANAAGALMRRNLGSTKQVNARTAHDVKLELDVRCQRVIERTLHRAFPAVAFLGEEGSAGMATAPFRWVVDPIDGTVNYSHGIPHACVCIALQQLGATQKRGTPADSYETVLGLIYDPFQDELWTATATEPARLNGKRIQVSTRSRLEETICVMGYGKSESMIRESLPLFGQLTIRCRKLRNMGSAGLGLAYVACGRFDAYVERGVSIWDIAAGGYIIERAGGEFWHKPLPEHGGFRLIASNGRLRKKIEALMRST